MNRPEIDLAERTKRTCCCLDMEREEKGGEDATWFPVIKGG